MERSTILGVQGAPPKSSGGGKTIIIIIVVLVVLIALGVGGYFLYKFSRRFINVPDGQPCSVNAQCENGKCGRYGPIVNSPLKCCPNGKSYSLVNFDFCGDMPDGTECNSDRACAGGKCLTLNGLPPLPLVPGKCITPALAGTKCSVDAECRSNSCNYGTDDTSVTRVCCGYGSVPSATRGVFFCKYVLNNGDKCLKNDQCKSRYCTSGAFSTDEGVCKNDTRTEGERAVDEYLDNSLERVLG